MEFVFCNKSKMEMDVITDVLHEENISYKIRKKVVENVFFDDEDDEDFVIIEETYEVHCFTDLEHFDFIKTITDEKIKNRIKLERCYIKKAKVRKDVQAISKKDNRDTINRNQSK